MHSLFSISLLDAARLRALNRMFQILHLLLQFSLGLGKLSEPGVQIDALLLGHKRLAHSIGDAALVEGLVGRDRHPSLISHSQQKQPSLSAVDGYLSD